MSRIGKLPITLPKDVKVAVSGNTVKVDGPKGSLTLSHNNKVAVKQEGDQVLVLRQGEERDHRACHGLYQRLISNMVLGVTRGYSKQLQIVGTGYKAQMEGDVLTLQVGLSHQPRYPVPKGLKITCPKPNQIVIEGIDKQLVGQAAADIRKIRPPEPYKGKGIRYSDERVRRKVGKAGAK